MIIGEKEIISDNLSNDLSTKGEAADLGKFIEKIKSINYRNSVFVDCTASDATAELYLDILKKGIHIVAANKRATTRSYQYYSDLKETASRNNLKFFYETNVAAALPVISTMNDLKRAGDKIIKIEGVLSGTLSFLFNNMTSEKKFSRIFKEAKAAGLMCAYVSNGNNTPEVMEYIRPYIDAYKVDLKSMNDKNYRKLGGVLQHTLDGIKRAHDLGLWVEIVTLTIPGFNDSNEELWDAARFIASVSNDIPWHVTAFHKDYKMTEPDDTPARTLLRAAEIGREAGLHYVYSGNLPGRVEEYEDTFCSHCNTKLIQRSGYIILEYHITASGQCPNCGTKVPGVWSQDPSKVQLNGYGAPIPVY